MGIEDIALVSGSAILLTILWMLIGIGVARMIGKINNKDLMIFDVIFWPVVSIVFAACGGVR